MSPESSRCAPHTFDGSTRSERVTRAGQAHSAHVRRGPTPSVSPEPARRAPHTFDGGTRNERVTSANRQR
ncbi:hypothetical protein ACFPM0_06765 [Pseudonocardia sulfidoxydans]|uniref:hypothetical protein n=1 Tax=Pseudonocardia sulfidoxydans TaxID=54011 RepID=UPI00361095CD